MAHKSGAIASLKSEAYLALKLRFMHRLFKTGFSMKMTKCWKFVIQIVQCTGIADVTKLTHPFLSLHHEPITYYIH